MKHFVVGVDVGGTNVKLGVVDGRAQVLARSAFSTKEYIQSPSRLIMAISRAVIELCKVADIPRKDVQGVGIGLPGLVDVQAGVIRVLPNIPGWKDVPLKKVLEGKLGLPVQVENDVNMITLGEWQYGAGKGIQNLICMTLGTGVGAGLILNNDIYRGPGFAAGEIGHAPLNEDGPACGCGGYGCYERYVGNKTLQKWAAEVFDQKDVTLEEVSRRAMQGKKKALRFWQEVGEKVGVGLVGPVNILNPECIIIGGGVSRSFEFIAPAVRKVIARRAMRTQADMVKVIRARLDDDAGLIGAKVLIHHEKN
ncbi:MAG: ROK family protein [Candidatus Omnitrophica bacterium]|nr:ROK family protein [Candidatus Omnitrophota bacterium]